MKLQPLILLVLLAFFLPDSAGAQKAYPFRSKDNWFLVDSSFQRIGSTNYSFIVPLSDKRFLVKNAEGFCGIATEQNKLLIPMKYDTIEVYNDVYSCAHGKSDAFFDNNGKPMEYPPLPTCGGAYGRVIHLRLYSRKGKTGWYHYNYKKKRMDTVPAIYDAVEEYLPHVGMAKLKGKWGIVHGSGNVLHRFELDTVQIYPFCTDYGSCINIVSINSRKGYMNARGYMLVPAKYLDAQFFHDRYALVMDDSRRWGYIDLSGREYFK